MDAIQENNDLPNLDKKAISQEALLQEIDLLKASLLEQEKLASLGQLTAGILHEIKNPLNFIINFSRISLSLLDELTESLNQVKDIDANLQDDLKDINNSLNGNLTKISENSNRAQRIILNMLNQSREYTSESFVKTDINQLVEEFVKLAYQGVRAQNKDFNMAIRTSFDSAIGEVSIVPQDFSRVILNIVNNACYALAKKKLAAGDSFCPVLEIETRKLEKEFTVTIKDNGIGIPPEVINKIFNPFFTTKPSADGTGLGLYLSYNIIQKIHKGRLVVNSVANEFSEFVLYIPLM